MTPRPGLTKPWTSGQLTAIAASSRTLVSAAAGSGKTSVLVERVVRSLLGDGGEHQPPRTDSRGVLAVTFTRKAAAEMRERIARELHAAGELEVLGQLELATIGTIHSLCGAVLREHGAAIGIDPGYTLLEDSQDSWYAQQTLDDIVANPPSDEITWLLQRCNEERTFAMIEKLRQVAARQVDGVLHFVDPELVTGNPATKVEERDAKRATAAVGELWRAFDAGFRARLERAGAVTFDDLERYALRAASDPAVATALRERWQLVAIDEFQDTNERQLRILDAIAGDRLFMVGDQWQSIYRFRGADVAVFEQERASTDTSTVLMLENFRSAAPVLDVVNDVFADPELFGAGYERVLAGSDRQRQVVGPSVELLLVNRSVTSVESALVEGEHRREREARRVAERIAELRDAGVSANDIVVVYETGTDVNRFELALRQLDIPTLRAASTGYYDQLDVRDVLTVLRAVRNPLDDLAVASVLTGPLARIGYGELAALLHHADVRRGHHRQRARDVERTSLLDLAMRSGSSPLVHAASCIQELRALEQRSSIVEVVEQIVGYPEFELAAASAGDGVQRLQNIRHLMSLAAEARRVGVADAARFLDYVDAQRRFQKLGDASVADEASGAVRLMTIHASKGLEFEHVFYIKADFVMDANRRGEFAGPLVDDAGVVHVPAPTTDGKLRDTGALATLRSREVELHHRERMRKAYVAMTRAKSQLYVSAAIDLVDEDQARADHVASDGSQDMMASASPLRWIRSTLGAWEDAVEGPRSLDLVIVDGRAASRSATAERDTVRPALVVPPPLCDLDALGIEPANDSSELDEPDPHALHHALARAVREARDDDFRLVEGERLHDSLARLIEAAVRGGVDRERLLEVGREPWLTEQRVRRLSTVVASPTFTRLLELGARAEVPWLASFGDVVASAANEGVPVVADADLVDAGRIDALAVLPDGRWWIVDWKTTLDAEHGDAWHEHGRQLTRYAVAARRSGAPGSVLTLASLAHDATMHTWDGSALDVGDVRGRIPAPQTASLP